MKQKLSFSGLQFTASYAEFSQIPEKNLPEVVFSGRSNVGKSSLINSLCQCSCARTSSTPGKTQLINLYRTATCCFADLPGYGYTRTGKSKKDNWSDLMENYFQSGRADLVVQCMDCRIDPTDRDWVMLRYLKQTAMHYICVFTKADKLNSTELSACKLRISELEKKLNCECILLVSSKNGLGFPELRNLILLVLSGCTDPADGVNR